MDYKRGKILVIEDDPASYKLIAATLKSSEIKLLHAENGSQAIEHFNSHTDIQLILLDIQLPGMNGYEILEQIRKIKPELPIIAQTAYSMADDREKCLNAGCNEYISKPLNIHKLRELVNKYIT